MSEGTDLHRHRPPSSRATPTRSRRSPIAAPRATCRERSRSRRSWSERSPPSPARPHGSAPTPCVKCARSRASQSLPSAARAELARADAATDSAESLLAAGDARAAARLFSAQLATRSRWLGADHEACATSRSALARASLMLGDIPRAIALDREVLSQRQRLLGARHPEVAASLDQLALHLKAGGDDRNEPLRLYRDALTLREELLGPDAPPTVETLIHLGNLYRVRRQPDSALAVFHRVVALDAGPHPIGDARMGDVLFAMAMTVTPRGDWEQAEPWLRDATRRLRSAGPVARPSLARVLGADGLALRHLGRAAEAETALVESVQLFEQMRREAPQSWTPIAGAPLVSYDLLAAVQLERGRGEEAWRSLERGLVRGLLEELARKGAIDTTGWWDGALGRVQRALPRDGALIGWLTTRPGAAREEYPFWAYCIRATGPVRWSRVDGPAAGGAADRDLDALRLELVRAASWPLRVTETSAIQRLARAAYELRMAPLEPGLRGVRRLVVVSPDLLHGTPVESLLDSTMTPLAERYVISYAPSALLYAAAQERRSAELRGRRWRALLVGDTGTESGPGALPALAAAHREIRELSARLDAPTVLLGRDAAATLDRMASDGALADYTLIHFATHATVTETWLGESALVLARDTTRAAGGGRITAREIAEHWRLGADLVTLAACETVVGPASANEGFQGLQHAFLSAGARHLLVSTWRVDDTATELLMSSLLRATVDSSWRRPRRA